ncbi:hypothetical protein [Paenibacillus ihumii]|uniref:hypothetical protein n=1 Tax=Paenibacillus ihumii TaxID=687436 RepID=UPI0006D861E2|nr:hypothetical protein [Paenibacillus ihumii]
MRRVEDGQKVLIAFHLHKQCFSIRLASTRKVAGYTDRIVVSDVRFPVSPSGRLRVLRERRKNVHAFVLGKYEQEMQNLSRLHFREAYYNPYQVSGFVDRETFRLIEFADYAICENKRVYYLVLQ